MAALDAYAIRSLQSVKEEEESRSSVLSTIYSVSTSASAYDKLVSIFNNGVEAMAASLEELVKLSSPIFSLIICKIS